ncbi:MAG TPA: class I SAM-dependent methyltransferase [Thermoanaerobaculia bacterium]|nr:class I SAM-dependent methyltransferase [Thermoanaerobaculia bacterium]
MRHPGAPFWVPSAALQRHTNRMATGDPGVDWLTHVRARHFRAEPRRTLVVGAGEGFLEIALARVPGAGTFTAVEADPETLSRARRRAERRGVTTIRHEVLDPDAAPLPEGPWEAVYAVGALHHAADPEALLRRLHDALAPSGRLVLVDYVGRDRFQETAAQAALLDRYFRLLPERLRRDPETGTARAGRAALELGRFSLRWPHEAAQSEKLLAQARRTFVEEATYGLGGGLLHPLLSGFEENFGRDAAGDERVLEVLGAAEDECRRSGAVGDAFATFVGRRRVT